MDYSATTVTAMQQQEGERPTVSSFTPIELTRDLVKAKVLASKTYPDVRRAYPVRLSRKPPPEWKAVFEQQEREFRMDKLPVFIDGALLYVECAESQLAEQLDSLEPIVAYANDACARARGNEAAIDAAEAKRKADEATRLDALARDLKKQKPKA